MNDSEYICPVPKDQRPLNEYRKLKESSNFVWCVMDKKTYLKSLFYLLISSFIVSSLVLLASSFSVTNSKYFLPYLYYRVLI